MDLFFLLVVVFISVLLGIGLAALFLSVLFKIIVRFSPARRTTAPLAGTPAPSQAPRA